MRGQSAPNGRWLAVFLLFAVLHKTASSQHAPCKCNRTANQQHLICKKPDSQQCVTWNLGPGADPDNIIEESLPNATQFCGLSDLKRILPHRKFITVNSLARGGNSKVVFCKGFTKLKGSIVNWKQVEKALNALSRTRRQTTFFPRGRYRGQTQSQYLAIDRGNGKDEGKAEAHSAADSSRASVSGNSGMGQAQSQSIFDPNCDDCYGKSDNEAESLKRGPYVPGSGGNQYTPTNGYSPSSSGTNGYRPGQGLNNGLYPPGSGYRPGQLPGGSPGRPEGYVPNGQQGGTGYEPVQGTQPGGTGYRPTSGTAPSGSQGVNGGYGPGGQLGGSGDYRPGQGTGSGGSPGGRDGYRPGGQLDGSGNYGPGQGNAPGASGFGPSSGSSPGGSPVGVGSNIPGGQQGGSGGYGPGQGIGPGTLGFGPSSGLTPGGGIPVSSGGFGPGRQQGGSGAYGPGLESHPGTSGFGPSSVSTPGGSTGGPGGHQGGSGGYGPSLGSGPGTSGFGPSLGNIPGSGPSGSGSYGPDGQQSGSGGYGPGQGGGPGTLGFGPKLGQGPGTGFVTGQNRGNGINYGNGPGLIGQAPSGNQGSISGQRGIPGGNVYNPGQGGSPSGAGGFAPGPIGQTNTGGFGPQQPSTSGQNGLPSGTFNTGHNGDSGGNVGYSPNQGPLTNGGYGPVQSGVPGGNGQVQPGGSGYGPTNYPSSGSFTPGQNNQIYGPVSGTNANKLTGSNWPLALGPYPGPPGSSVYCCVVPNSYGQNIGTGGNVLPSTGTGYPQYGTENGGPTITAGSNLLHPNGAPSSLFGPTHGPDNTGSTNIRGPNNMQGPQTYDNGLVGGPNGIGNINDPSRTYKTQPGEFGNYGPGVSVGPGGQNGMQGPGNFGTVSTGGPGGQNGILGSGTYVPVTSGGPGVQNGVQRPGIYGTDIYGDPGLRQPAISGEPGNQNNIYGPGGISSRPGQNAIQGPGNFGTGQTGGLGGQNGILGQNSKQSPVSYGPGIAGERGSHNGIQEPRIYGAGEPGGPGGHIDNQSPGIYSTGTPGGLGQNGLQGPGTYGTFSGPGGNNGMQGPGRYDTGVSGGPHSLNGMQGPATYGTVSPGGIGPHGTGSNQNMPNQQGGSGQNIGTNGGPGTYGVPNGNTISGSGPSGYPGTQNQFPPNSQGPEGQTYGGNTGLYGNEPQGSLNSRPTGNQPGFNGQGNTLQGNEYNGIPENFVDPNSIAIDGDDSEAEAVVNQAANGTTASASSKGGNDKGRAQTHVHGTYTGGGSFQAQAQITGENKEAESEVSGGKKGASSSATGSGRNNKSQASVQLGSESGSIQTQSQSNGVMHSSNSQVQGSVKGGMADAQARGPGSTSSQAQIGFTPYKDGDKVHEHLQTPFTGGGIASSQSSGRTGQSQSQLHGTFKYGITYNGAAQSGASLDKDAIFPNRLNFEKIDVFDETKKYINLTGSPGTDIPPTESIPLSEVPLETKTNINNNEITTEKGNDETMKNSESRYSSHTHLDHHKTDIPPVPAPTPVGSRRSFQPGYDNTVADYEYTTDKDEIQPEEYDTDPGYGAEGNDATDVEQTAGEEFSNYDEYSRDYQTHQSLQSPRRKGLEVQQSTSGNTQHIVLGSLSNHDAEITQRNSEKPDESKVYQPGERVPGITGYRIPMGFTGSVKSVASKENTYVVGSKHSPSQAQTVTLTPGAGRVNYVHPPNYGKYVKPKDLRSLQSQNPRDDRYVSVSKSVTRALDGDNNIRKQYSHTYYTKSSSCGYFTFTCTMVSGVDGRKKVCKPKIPTNPDGTPIRC